MRLHLPDRSRGQLGHPPSGRVRWPRRPRWRSGADL